MASLDFIDQELMDQVGSELVIVQNRVLDIDSLGVEKLAHVLLHQTDANMVIIYPNFALILDV